MRFKYLFLCLMTVLYYVDGKPREVLCPEFCTCDVLNNFRRAMCQSKKLVTAEINMPPEVEILDLSYNQISELGNKVFADMGLTQLKLLNLSNNKISQIHMLGFEGLDNLKSLDLSFNIMEYFLDQWFPSLKKLQELYLQGNNLVLINKQPILNLPSLKVLDLSQSKIEYFNPNVFTALPNLEILDISSNYLQRLNVDVLAQLTNLKMLIAKDNNFHCEEEAMTLLRDFIKDKGIVYIGPCIETFNEETAINEKLATPIQKSAKILGTEPPIESKGKEVPAEKSFNKVQSSATLKNAEAPEEDSGKIGIYGRLPTVDDSDVLADLEKYINSEKFQKMRMEDKPEYKNPGFSEDDSNNEISIKENLKKVDDGTIYDDLKNFDDFKKDIVKENMAVPVRKVYSEEVPESSMERPILKTLEEASPTKNAWIVDDEEIYGTTIKFVEVCNGTSRKNSNILDKYIMEVLEISPSGMLALFTALGLMAGMIVGTVSSGIGLPSKIKDSGKSILDILKPRTPKGPSDPENKPGPNGKESDKDNKDKLPKIEDEVSKKKKDSSNSAPPHKDYQQEECYSDICDSDPENPPKEGKNRGGGRGRGRGRGRGGRSGSRSPRRRSRSPGGHRKGSRSPSGERVGHKMSLGGLESAAPGGTDEHSPLLDNEEVQDGSSPLMGKKVFDDFPKQSME